MTPIDPLSPCLKVCTNASPPILERTFTIPPLVLNKPFKFDGDKKSAVWDRALLPCSKIEGRMILYWNPGGNDCRPAAPIDLNPESVLLRFLNFLF